VVIATGPFQTPAVPPLAAGLDPTVSQLHNVLGLPWQHSRGSALLGFVGHDAVHLAELVAAHAATPPTWRNHRCDTAATPRSLFP
jgi:hypothetical protein